MLVPNHLDAGQYSVWTRELRAKFDVAEEYHLAAAIYPFGTDFENGKSPAQSYASFDDWAQCNEDA